jgi:hypothetical protein
MAYDVTSAIIDYEDGNLDEDATIELFQYLVDTGMAWTLQGSYGRMAHRLIQDGLVSPVKIQAQIDSLREGDLNG